MTHEPLKQAIKGQIHDLQPETEGWSPQQLLRWAFQTFGQSVAISSAFGSAGMVLIDMAARLRGPDFRLFTLDTQYLFPETYHLMHQIEQKYCIAIERVYPAQTPEQQQVAYGDALWTRDPDVCCNLRKVEPLRRKLGTLAAWITSIRREQTSERAHTPKTQWDAKFDLVKINPIADWTDKQVWRYIHDHEVPYNSLHDQDYPSIGCTHCTRPVLSGEHQRAGRWSGFAKNECGLHIIESATSSSC